MPSEPSQPAPLATRLSRRSFLGQCSSAAGKVASGVVAAPLVIQAELEAALDKKKLRLGLLGVGHQGLRWAEAIQTSADTELVSWFDPEASQLEKSAGLLRKKGIGGPQATLSESILLENAEVDAIVVASPSHLHFQQIIRAIECGKHILAEKPVGFTSVEIRQIEKKLGETDQSVFMTAWSRRYCPGRQALMKWLKTSPMGKMLEMQICWNQPQGPPQGRNGWMLETKATGDWLAEHGDHVWDLLFELRPEMSPNVVKAVRHGQKERPSRYFSVVLDWPDGCLAHFRHSMLPNSGFLPPGLSFLIQFENGVVDLISGRISASNKINPAKSEFSRNENELHPILGVFIDRISASDSVVNRENLAELARAGQIQSLRDSIAEQFVHLH
ncbi:MAG: Gfo/Idh/MocA family protein [bacterium]